MCRENNAPHVSLETSPPGTCKFLPWPGLEPTGYGAELLQANILNFSTKGAPFFRSVWANCAGLFQATQKALFRVMLIRAFSVPMSFIRISQKMKKLLQVRESSD